MPSEQAAGISVRELTTLADLESLRDDWTRLWQCSPRATPFQSPAWLISWWQHLAGEGLWSLAFWFEDELIGLAPMFVYQPEPSAPKQLTFIGTGISDYLDILATPEFETEVMTEFFAVLAAHHNRWDICNFEELAPESLLGTAEIPAGLRGRFVEQSICPVLRLPKTPEELPNVIPARTLEKLRYYRRRIAKAGRWEIQRATSESFEPIFQAFVALHSRR